MELEENLISEELLEEADIAFCSNFKREAYFEMPVFMSRIAEHFDETSMFFDVKAPRRSMSSIEAEVHLCKQLGWSPVLRVDNELYKFSEILDVIKKAATICDKKIDVAMGSLTRNELDMTRPYVSTIIARLASVNKGVQKRFVPNKLIFDQLATLGEAKGFEKGLDIILGMGETLDDVPELIRFIQTHGISKVTFFLADKQAAQKRPPSSFYVARWIAETRIRFPSIKIVAGTLLERQAEVGLFMRAGANAITQFPALKIFNSEQSRIIEEEFKNAKRNFIGTFSDSSKLDAIDRSLIKEEVLGKLEKYIEAMKRK